MATRPTKTGGNTTYTAEVASGNTTIKSSEIDGDLTEIYSNITNANVASGAAIAYSKLALTNSIVTADLTANAVTTAKITDANITAAKLINGATFIQFVQIRSTFPGTAFTTETTVQTLAITIARTRVRITAAINFSGGGTGSPFLKFRLKRDASTIATDETVALSGTTVYGGHTIMYVDTTTAAAHTYTVTAERSGGSDSFQAAVALTIEEIA